MRIEVRGVRVRRLFLTALFALLAVPSDAQEVGEAEAEAVVRLTPFQIDERFIRTSSPAVQYYIYDQVHQNNRLSERDFIRFYGEMQRQNLAVRAYYIATFLYLAEFSFEQELIDILNRAASDDDLRGIILEFEQEYFEINGTYPSEFSGVDLASVTRRVQQRRRIR